VQKRVPEYMVPTEFIFLQKMPLTPNGKINRRALQAAKPDSAAQTTPAATVADPVQAQLVKIWEELLGRKPIGIRDNFFELGGHSLLAARLMHRVKQVQVSSAGRLAGRAHCRATRGGVAGWFVGPLVVAGGDSARGFKAAILLCAWSRR
jgi:hypothetical protein